MAEIYRYKGRLYVIRNREMVGQVGRRAEEQAYRLTKSGLEVLVNWSADVIRTLGVRLEGCGAAPPVMFEVAQ